MVKKVLSTKYCNFSLRIVKGALVLFLSFLCSCIPITERTIAPIDLPANFSIQGEVPPQARWWLDLQDSSLTLLIDQAITDNFSLAIARERIEEARAIARQAGASLLPTLDGQGAASSFRNYETNRTTENYSLGLVASYEIDLWGRLRSQRDAAVLEAMATEADYHTAAISLAGELANTWYLLVEAELQVKLLTQQKETNSKVLELISAQFRSGKVGIADVLQQRQLVETNNGNLAGLRGDIRVLEHQLAILIGLPPGIAGLPQRDLLPILLPLPDTGIPLDVLSERPDVESSFFRLRAADNLVATAIADRYPRLSISADLSTSGERSSDLFNNWFSTLGANLFGPLFDGGLRKAEVARNESIAKQQFYSHGQTILDAIGEVENSLVRENEQLVILGSLEMQLQYATETIQHVANRYRQGAEDYQRVLLALLSQQGLQRDILTSRRQLINFRIALYRAISGRIPLLEPGPAEIAENAANSSDIPEPLDHQNKNHPNTRQ
jgi:NodT family efflux transporter outer membrane factor (OMF) lipoprotein